MKSIGKFLRTFGIALCAFVAIIAMSAVSFAEEEQVQTKGFEPVNYTDEKGETQTLQVDDYYLVDETVDRTGTMGVSGQTRWYVSYGGTLMQRIKVQGDVRLVLVDDTDTEAKSGIEVPKGSSLSIYSYGSSGPWGRLIATGTKMNAGIGSNGAINDDNPECGTINIYGGWIKATGGQYAAGVGGGYGRIYYDEEFGGDGGTFLMQEGTLIAQGGEAGAGIGGGRRGDSGTITINKGMITATAGAGGAGIGGGEGSASTASFETGGCTNKITINGGDVRAYGADDKDGYGGGAGIGGGKGANGTKGSYDKNSSTGKSGNENKIRITGGKVEARGADNGGAGIGGGMHSINDWYDNGAGANVEITGGEVYAYGGAQAAGIGSTRCEMEGSGDTIITGGKVVAQGGDYAAGIGTGNDPHRLAVNSRWEKLYNIEIRGNADVTATGGKEGAGIGCGNEGLRSAGAHGDLVISENAKVTAKGGKYGAGIGGGDQNVNGSVNISGNAEVTATGGYGGAGIGLGDNPDKESYAGKITISGGTVNANGGEYGAGIGGGDTSNMLCALDITGGRITAKAGKEAAGIGGGNHTFWSGGGNGGDVTIKYPEDITADNYVYAISGEDASPIGRGDDGDSDGNLNFKSRLSVKSNDSETSQSVLAEKDPVSTDKRISTCQSTNTTEVLIQNCAHKMSYTYRDVFQHTAQCSYCNESYQEQHDPNEITCKKCKNNNYIVTFKEGKEMRKEHYISVEPGKSFVFPDCNESLIPEGMAFAGWGNGTYTMEPGKTRRPAGNEMWSAVYTDKVVISFDSNGGSGVMPTVDSYEGYIYRLPECKFTAPEGKEFDHWELDGEIYYPDGSYEVGTKDAVFTAVWNDHDFSWDGAHHEGKAATCTEPGSNEYWECKLCKRCYRDAEGKLEISRADIAIPAKGHQWDEPTYTWSDDFETVTASRVCLNDAAGDHTEIEIANTVEETTKPTCFKEGQTVFTAQFDNPAFKKQTNTIVLDRVGHNWSDWIDNGNGTETRSCLNEGCGATETQDKDHVHSMIHYNRVEPKCEEQGKKEYWKCEICEKLYTDETGNQEITDEGSLGISATGHKFGEPVSAVIKEASCNEEGVVRVRYSCERCNFAKDEHPNTPALGHRWDSGIVTTAASCEEAGEKTYTCLNDAEHTKKETIRALGHDWGDWIIETGQDGMIYEVRHCTRCVAKEQVPKGDAGCAHEQVTIKEGTPATCTESGLKDQYQCEECGAYLIKGEDGNYTMVTAADYEEYISDQTIRPLGHDWGTPSYVWADDNTTVKATCTCRRSGCSSDPLTETAEVTKTEKPATRFKDGEMQYIAQFNEDLFETQIKKERIPATGEEDVIAAAADAETLLATANEINPKDFSAKTYAAVRTAMKELNKVLNDDACTAEEIKTATQALQSAIDGLKTDAQEDAEAMIAKAKAIKKGNYSNKSYAAVTNAIKALEKILADKEATDGQVKTATQNLDKAIKALKMNQKLNIKKKTIKIKAKKLKKKARKVKPLTVKGAKTKVTYKGVGLNKKSKKALKINKKTGKITVKKKTKKGTYKMKVTVTAAGSAKYEPAKRTVTVTIKVKK